MPHPDPPHPPKRRRFDPQPPSSQYQSSTSPIPSSAQNQNPSLYQPPWRNSLFTPQSQHPFPTFDPSALQNPSLPYFDPSKTSLPLANPLPPPIDPFTYPLPPPLAALAQIPRPRQPNPTPSATMHQQNSFRPNTVTPRNNTTHPSAPAIARRPAPPPAPSSQRPRLNSSTPTSSAPPTTTPTTPTPSLRQIYPVKEALANLRDGCSIMAALAQTFSQRISQHLAVDHQRIVVLDFRGFSPTARPAFSPLLTLSKTELDVLAWIFVVSKHGRKEDVARRIVTSLREPLKYRSPSPFKKPFIPEHSNAHAAQQTNTENNQRNTNSRASTRANTTQQSQRSSWRNTPVRSNTRPAPPAVPTRPSARSSMPSLAPQPVSRAPIAPSTANGTAASSSLLNNLARQIQNEPRSSPSAVANRSKQVRELCQEMLEGYGFLSGETPFNCPMNPPLGTRRYIFFTSVQLSRGYDPSLIFPTPLPLCPTKQPFVTQGDLQIHIRCLRVEIEKARTEWKQAWPFPASCRVNGNNVPLNQAQRYTNGKLAGRDGATNITPFLRKQKQSGGNEINRVVLRRQNSTATAATGQYVFFAQEILVISHESMTKSVIEASEKYWVDYRVGWEKKGFPATASKFEMAQHGVIQFLTDPEGLTVASMKVSLRCPLALTRITTPVKGKRCQHVQCFDLSNFLEYSRRSSKFDCPVCNKGTASPLNLVVSPYIEYALEKYKDCDEVEIFQDGGMVPVERKQTGVASEDDEEGTASNVPNGNSGKPSRPANASTAKVAEVVDLTLDSDDEDPPTAAASSPSANHDAFLPAESRTNSHSAEPAGQDSTSGQDANAIQTIEEQDMDFEFRSDFVPWGDSVQAVDDLTGGGLRLQNSNNARNDWSCDVIAIDSD